MATPERRALLGLAHKAALLAGLDDDTRRAVQKRVTGKDSCRDMSDAQLRRLLWHYKGLGVEIGVPNPPAPGGTGWERPTKWQWMEIERLALAMGWEDGLEDARLLGFVRRTAGVDAMRFLSRAQASAVISGLRRWEHQRHRRKGRTA